MSLLIDIGNSRIKWAQHTGANLHTFEACSYSSTSLNDSLKPAWSDLAKPDKVYVANVAGEKIAVEISDLLDSLWNITPVFLAVEQEALGLTNAYDDAGQLGIDRWLAMISAWNKYHSLLCVVDCGTALTLDVVMASGQHVGGYIVPGLSLMTDTLNRQTQQIDSSRNQHASLEPGRNTLDCVSNGALLAITSLIKDANEMLMNKHGSDSTCIITGGYAEEIVTSLEIDYIHDPHLVLNGMALMSEKLR